MELQVPRIGGNVRLDILGVTPFGKLVLIECKLFRNPGARREVVGQILEYAALVKTWTYADLESRLKAHSAHRNDPHWERQNPLFQMVKERFPQIDEASFVDNVSRSLVNGDFVLAVVGDGIRRDLQPIRDLLERQGGLLAQFGLVEIQIWKDSAGRTLLVPSLLARTEVIQHRVVVSNDGKPLSVVESIEEDGLLFDDPDAAAKAQRDLEFWDEFARVVRFDHPEQPAPIKGRHSTTRRLPLPEPAQWMTLYRMDNGYLEIFISLRGEGGRDCFELLKDELKDIRTETDLDIVLYDEKSSSPGFRVRRPIHEVPALSMPGQVEWMASAANSMVNAFRPRLAQFAREREAT